MKLKTPGKIALFIVAVGAAAGIYRATTGGFGNLIPSAATSSSTVPPVADLPGGIGSTSGGPGRPVTIPSVNPVGSSSNTIRILHWAWNAHLGAMYANGGKQTTEGSLVAQQGLNVAFTRQDDPTKMQEELVTFATELSKGNKNPGIGAHFVTIMGDGGAAFLDGLNKTLSRLGPEYKAKVVGAIGYSLGEDKFMGPQSWKSNPAASRGGVVAGYLRDGDWNIAMKWLADNGLPNNPDEKTYDPTALNWVAANDYIDAAEKYVAGYSETRPVVRNGRRTGEMKKITVQASVTWTPGDVTIAQKKGGIVNIVSTREYSSQMPCIVIGIDKWMKANKGSVEKMLQAFFDGGAAVKGSEQALQHAAKVADEAFAEEGTGPEYWVKYYKGVTETDVTGLEVELGGSSVNNLADAMYTFGLVSGSQNLFAATYTVFGNVVKQQYPDLLPSFPPADQITDLSYLRALAARNGPTSGEIAASVPQPVKPKPGAKPTPTISRKAWNIQFASGRASFTNQANSQLFKLLNELLVAGNTVIEIHGHTDNVGNANNNMSLSEQRAFAVKTWLERKAQTNFPSGKIRVFAHGQTNPVAPNTSEQGRQRNRRVEIVLRAAD